MPIDSPGKFYLGCELDASGEIDHSRPILYKSDRLVTHGVCFGMTGSGKTGICLDLLEEAALSEIPAIIIDPKGDITNLLLAFPDQSPASFAPWVDPDAASRAGMSVPDFAADTAGKWKAGLQSWGISGDRIASMQAKSAFTIYTPGSESGVPVNLLGSLSRPEGFDTEDNERFSDATSGIASALLGLVGVDAEPLTSPEHILINNIIQHAWLGEETLDLERLILYIQSPPFRKLGVFEVDKLFPAADRMKLAMRLNGILASPGFGVWTKGAALDIDSVIRSDDGRPRSAVFYCAHLSDKERMFFITMLLETVLAWTRRQSGSSSLRALIYFDEVFGYMPPTANPPTKKPLLTLLKQARAFGVGVMLVTQNPMDLDYKGLTNTGLWIVGRLQTDRDKARVLEALETASGGAAHFDKNAVSSQLSSLKSRQFIFHDTKAAAPLLIHSRWAMSYLRGPLTREEIGKLAFDRPSEQQQAISASAPSAAGGTGVASMPGLPADLAFRFLSPETVNKVGLREALGLELQTFREDNTVYHPTALVKGRLRFDEDRDRYVVEQDILRMVWPEDDPRSWVDLSDLEGGLPLIESAPAGGRFLLPPEWLTKATDRRKLRTDLINTIYANCRLEVFYNEALKLFAHPDETEAAFTDRVRQALEDGRDAAVAKLEDRYKRKMETIAGRIAQQQLKVESDRETLEARKREKMMSAGASILGAFLGGRSRGFGSLLSRGGSVMTKQRMQETAANRVEAGQQKLEQLEQDFASLKEELDNEIAAITAGWEAKLEITTKDIRLEKNDISILEQDVMLVWMPLAEC